MDRRRFLATTAAIAAAPSLVSAAPKRPGPICFFSKHLPKLGPREMAKRLRAVGFDGIELTVRPGGHVLPEQVQTALPKAIEEIRAEGMDVPIIATALTSADDPTLGPILSTAAKLGVGIFRTGWFSYAYNDVHAELRRAGQALARLADAAKRAHIALAYQNHVGQLGGAVWDLSSIIEPLDSRWAGVYFDIRHAVAEGTGGSWKLATHLVAPRVKVFSVKDFYWARAPNGSWEAKDCPLGQGMVDLRLPLQLMANQSFRGPFTVFLEYEPAGGAGEDKIVAAAGRDLKFLKDRLAEVYA
jgi:L-ribulose-5-phosphate 3-epimerase